MNNTLSAAQEAIGYTFKDKSLLLRALTLASAGEDNNQLLEFFGDAILEFIVSERILTEENSEGRLTERRKALVADSALTPVSQKLGLDKLLIRGKNDTGNKKAIPSVYEAVVAAIYLDGGMDEAKKFVLSTLDFSGRDTIRNYRGELQELMQAEGKPLPEYVSLDIGTPQSHNFRVTVSVDGHSYYGEARTVKKATELAAKYALEHLSKK